MKRYNKARGSDGTVTRWLMKRFEQSIVFGVVLLLLVGAGLYYYGATRRPSLRTLRIAYGPGDSVRKNFLDQMVVHGRERNLDIRMVTSESTDQTLSLLNRNAIDLGLITGGIEVQTNQRILEITPLYMEPLHLLVKPELYEPVIRDFGQLRGKTIDLDVKGTATRILSSEILRFIGLQDRVTNHPQYREVHVPQARLLETRDASSLPDAIFAISGIPSPGIDQLVDNLNYRVVPLPFGGSFNLSKFREAESAPPSGDARLRLDKTFVEEFSIPAFVYSVLPAVPVTDARTIATRLVLVGSEKLDNKTVHRILDLVYSPEVGDLAKPELTARILDHEFQFERHPGTETYVDSLKPFSYEDAMSTYGKITSVWGIIIAAYFASIKGLKRLRRVKETEHGTSVRDFWAQILEVEAAAGESSTVADRKLLDRRLSEIKKRSVELYLDEQLDEEDNFQAMLVTLADARARIWGPGSEGL